MQSCNKNFEKRINWTVQNCVLSTMRYFWVDFKLCYRSDYTKTKFEDGLNTGNYFKIACSCNINNKNRETRLIDHNTILEKNTAFS